MDTILIVEDDFLNRRLIKKILDEAGYLVKEASNSTKAFEILEKESIAAAILDINLGSNEKDGIEIGHFIQEKYGLPIIYLTAYETSEIIKRAISTSPTSYITKPFKNVDLLVSVRIALQSKKTKNSIDSNVISVKHNDYFQSIPIPDIDYIESEGNYLIIHTGNEAYRYRSTIKNILNMLPSDVFIQTHRAFIVNKQKIQKYSHKHVIIRNVEIPISKNFIEELTALSKR